MRALNDIQRMDFLGIGGIGMSALARYFRERGVRVHGYDRSSTPLTRQLASEGIVVRHDPAPLEGPAPDLVVYTPAVPRELPSLAFYRAGGVPLKKRSQVLGMITREMYAVTVAGTHGKTTVSAMIAHVLRHSGYGCNAFLGGILVNYDTNYWSDPRPTAVIEADEYDRSFLELSPDIAVITAMDADHLDIYGTLAAMQDAYVDYTRLIAPTGTLVHKLGLPRTGEMGGAAKITYSLTDGAADAHAEDIRVSDGLYRFSVQGPGWRIPGMTLGIGGLHNVENAVAATTVTRVMGIADDRIRAALAAFRGTKRRFEYVYRDAHAVYIDDYAHHPEELRALISGTRHLFPGRKLSIIFQPHLYSRTRDLAGAFAEVLSQADEVILMPVYPAREAPLPGVDSELISRKMPNPGARVLSAPEVLDFIARHRPELLVTAGAGDIDQLVGPLKDMMSGGNDGPGKEPSNA